MNSISHGVTISRNAITVPDADALLIGRMRIWEVNRMKNVFNVSEDVLKLAIALSRPIEELELSHRSWNCLRRWGLYTVGDVCKAYYEGKLPK